jgi:hypothetical protein
MAAANPAPGQSLIRKSNVTIVPSDQARGNRTSADLTSEPPATAPARPAMIASTRSTASASLGEPLDGSAPPPIIFLCGCDLMPPAEVIHLEFLSATTSGCVRVTHATVLAQPDARRSWTRHRSDGRGRVHLSVLGRQTATARGTPLDRSNDLRFSCWYLLRGSGDERSLRIEREEMGQRPQLRDRADFCLTAFNPFAGELARKLAFAARVPGLAELCSSELRTATSRRA